MLTAQWPSGAIVCAYSYSIMMLCMHVCVCVWLVALPTAACLYGGGYLLYANGMMIFNDQTQLACYRYAYVCVCLCVCECVCVCVHEMH